MTHVASTTASRIRSAAIFFLCFIFGIVFFSLPLRAHAQQQDTTGGGSSTGITYVCQHTYPGDCTFSDLVYAVQKVMKWAVGFALMISVIVIIMAGFKYLMSGGSASERTKANEMLIKVVKGIVFILAAWLIVTLITNTILSKTVQQSIPLTNS